MPLPALELGVCEKFAKYDINYFQTDKKILKYSKHRLLGFF